MSIINVGFLFLQTTIMKVMFPQHIKKGFFSWVAFPIMWYSITFIQLIILAIGVVFALWIFSSLSNSGAKWLWVFLAILIFIIFVFIAFFNFSELNILAFTAKKIKDWFLDVSKKFQTNYSKIDPVELNIAKSKQEKWKKRIEIKEDLDLSKLNEIEKWWILG